MLDQVLVIAAVAICAVVVFGIIIGKHRTG
jgi:hypothetical protein